MASGTRIFRFAIKELTNSQLIGKFPGPLGQSADGLEVFLEQPEFEKDFSLIAAFLKCLIGNRDPSRSLFLIENFPVEDAGGEFCHFICRGDLFSALNLAHEHSNLWPFAISTALIFSNEQETREFTVNSFAKQIGNVHGNVHEKTHAPCDNKSPWLQALAAVLQAATGEPDLPALLRHWRIVASLCAPFTISRSFAVNILTLLGKSLTADKKIEEGHVCHLLAAQILEPVDSPTSAIALLGADHTDIFKFRMLLEPKVFMLSEIFEFSQRQLGKQQALPALQPFKYAYSCYLADFGFTDRAERYMAFLDAFIKSLPASRFSSSFRSNAKDFQKRLAGYRSAASPVTSQPASPAKSIISGLWGLVT